MRELEEYKGKRVILMACSKCNVSCTHCYIGYKGNRDPQELAELTQKFVEEGKLVRIDGAEVLTDLEYLKAYKIAEQEWIMSNGLRIFQEPEVIDIMKENGIDTVYMSYHFGIQDSLNKITSAMLDEVIKLLREKGMKIVLMTTITNQNVSQVENMCDRAYNLGATGIEFNKMFSQGRAKKLENLDLSVADYRTFFTQLRDSRTKYDISDLEVARSGTFGEDFVTNNNRFKCSAGLRKVVITPDNNVYGCTSICKPGYEIGIYKNGTIYRYKDFFHDRTWCLADKLGSLNIDDITELNNEPVKSLKRN
ncbi:MAG: radical SAM protein [Bacilli bacterium]|nr:radical SAM protein [Bacilli bacterium]